jgi:hypothetical protein
MTKSFLKFTLYIIIKWLVFYTYQFIEKNEKWTWERPEGKDGLFLAAFMLLGLPILELILLFLPFHFALKQKGWLLLLLLAIIFISEFFIGFYLTNQNIELWMIIKIIISILIFGLMYREQLKAFNSNS